ncbi:MAG: hypothetical protein RPS47_07735 [Colwellia sp.]
MMFKKINDRSKDYSERSYKVLYKALADSKPNSIIRGKVEAELARRANQSHKVRWVIGTVLVLAGLGIALLNYVNG